MSNWDNDRSKLTGAACNIAELLDYETNSDANPSISNETVLQIAALPPTLPRHVSLTIKHQPHASCYQTVEGWLEDSDHVDILDADRAAMIATGEVWTVQWYPDTPVGFYCVGAATLERALQLANAP